MSQIFLDPSKAANQPNLNSWIPKGPIPLSLRKFGYCPNFDDWFPGDLVLVSAIKPDFIAKAIRSVQKKGGYANDDARWEHAAVHIGTGALCEANRKGVCLGHIFDYADSHLIRIRRNPLFDKDKGWELAVEALKQKQKNYSYNFSSIVNLLLNSRNGFWQAENIKKNRFPKRAVICSELYADSHVMVCSQALGNLRSAEITPASLSIEKLLVDVKTNWVKIESL